MYVKKIEVKGPFAKFRFKVIDNYDKLLHITLTFVVLAFLFPVSILLASALVIGLQIAKEIFDYICGDDIHGIANDLAADVLGWGLFLFWYSL